MSLTWSSFTFASLRCGQQALNIEYVLADKRSKQSSYFNRLCSILCANGSTILFLFYINTPLFSHSLNYLSSFPSFQIMIERTCLWCIKGTVLEIYSLFIQIVKATTDWEAGLLEERLICPICQYVEKLTELNRFISVSELNFFGVIWKLFSVSANICANKCFLHKRLYKQPKSFLCDIF